MMIEIAFKHINQYIFHKDGNFSPQQLIVDNMKKVNVLPPVVTMVGALGSLLYQEINISKQSIWEKKVEYLINLLNLDPENKIYGTWLKFIDSSENISYYFYIGYNIFLEYNFLKDLISYIFSKENIINKSNNDYEIVEIIKSFIYTYRKKPKFCDLIFDIILYILYQFDNDNKNEIKEISKKIVFGIPYQKVGISLEDEIKTPKKGYLYFTSEIYYETLYNLLFDNKICYDKYFIILFENELDLLDKIKNMPVKLGAKNKFSKIEVKKPKNYIQQNLWKIEDIVENFKSTSISKNSIVGFNTLISVYNSDDNIIPVYLSTSPIILKWEWDNKEPTIFLNTILEKLYLDIDETNTHIKIFEKFIVWGNLSLMSSYYLKENTRTESKYYIEPGALLFPKSSKEKTNNK